MRNSGDGNQDEAALDRFAVLIAEHGFVRMAKRKFGRESVPKIIQMIDLTVSLKEGEWTTIDPELGVRFEEVHQIDASLLGRSVSKGVRGMTVTASLQHLMPRGSHKTLARKYRCFPSGSWDFRSAPEVDKKARAMCDATIEFGGPYFDAAANLDYLVETEPLDPLHDHNPKYANTRFSVDMEGCRRHQIIAAAMSGRKFRASRLLEKYNGLSDKNSEWLRAVRQRYDL